MTDRLSEKTISSTQLTDGFLDVYRDTVALPDGRTSSREWIDHEGAAAVVPLRDDGHVVLVRQYRYALRKILEEVPAGRLDQEAEDPAALALRELAEETGYQAQRLDRLGSLYPAIGYSNEIIHFFLARDLQAGEQSLGDGEFVEVVTRRWEEAVEQARTGGFEDLKTTSALLLADAFLAREAAATGAS